MSRMAQAVTRAVAELKASRRKARRTVEEHVKQEQPVDAASAVTSTEEREDVTEQLTDSATATEPQAAPVPAHTTSGEKKKMAKKKKAARKGVAKKTSANGRGASITKLQSVGSAKVEKVVAEKKNVYATLHFADGFVLRLKPVNLDMPTTKRVREWLVEFLSKNL